VTVSAQAEERSSLQAPDRDRLIRYARLLAWSSLAWMTAEGVIAVVAGVLANSVALIGFGIDSAIEGLASVIIIIWRFWGSRALSESAERRAQKLVAISFFLLAPYIAIEAVRALVTGSEPETSWLGIGLTIGSAIAMPFFGVAKKRVGAKLSSAATEGEGTQNLICAYLAVGVLIGLLANTAFGLWWLDPIIALGIAGLAIHEGLEAWEGEECC
jgi:divalent metal cation (Fe/Co/Zn/Cd) transporter